MNHDPRGTACGKRRDQTVNFSFRADVDAARRLVEIQYAGAVNSHRPTRTFCWFPPLRC